MEHTRKSAFTFSIIQLLCSYFNRLVGLYIHTTCCAFLRRFPRRLVLESYSSGSERISEDSKNSDLGSKAATAPPLLPPPNVWPEAKPPTPQYRATLAKRRKSPLLLLQHDDCVVIPSSLLPQPEAYVVVGASVSAPTATPMAKQGNPPPNISTTKLLLMVGCNNHPKLTLACFFRLQSLLSRPKRCHHPSITENVLSFVRSSLGGSFYITRCFFPLMDGGPKDLCRCMESKEDFERN